MAIFNTFLFSLCLILSPLETWAQVGLKITASDGSDGDNFGGSVSISGDYAVVGATGDDNQSNSGSLYVFRKEGLSWGQMSKITPDNGNLGDGFGGPVVIDGEYFITGASRDGNDTLRAGSAYIFHLKDGKWTQISKLIPADGSDGDYFGYSLAINGDFAIVGAPYADVNGANSGAAYIFQREDSTWTQLIKITPSDGQVSDEFGSSVDISGQYAIIGAPRDGDNGSKSGSAYLFRNDGNSWIEIQKLTAFDAASGDSFGGAVSIESDLILIGASTDNHEGQRSGSTYLYRLNNLEWQYVDKVVSNDGAGYDLFGHQTAIASDYMIVGAPWDNSIAERSGSAYIFYNNDSSKVQIAKLNPYDQALDDRFGQAVSISRGHAIVGAWKDDELGENAGAAYIYDLSMIPTNVGNEGLYSGVSEHQSLYIQNFPNPFSNFTTIEYTLSRSSHVRVEVFDMLGRKVKSLVNRSQIPGHYEVTLDASELPGGMYMYRLSAGNDAESKMLTLLK